MKPAFALSLSQEGIVLLQRRLQGFVAVAEADPEDAGLTDRLADMRKTAERLAPEGFSTKLILPESQILYTEVLAPGPDRAARRAQIGKALEGRTPYAVADLVFDWSGTGRTVQVAVVARITLEEADAFAEDHGFNPVCFVAVPPAGRFAGEPYFGMTARAGDHLPEGARLDRDQDPVRVVADEDALPARVQEADEPPFRIVVGDDPEVSGETGVTSGLIQETGAAMPDRLAADVGPVADAAAVDAAGAADDLPGPEAAEDALSDVAEVAAEDAAPAGAVPDGTDDDPVAGSLPDPAIPDLDALPQPTEDALPGQPGGSGIAAAVADDLPAAMAPPMVSDAGADAGPESGPAPAPAPTPEFATRRSRRDRRRDDRQAADAGMAAPPDMPAAAPPVAPPPGPRLGPATDPWPVTSPGLSSVPDRPVPPPAPRVERPVLKPARKPAAANGRGGGPSLLSRILPRGQLQSAPVQTPRVAARSAQSGFSRPGARGRPQYMGLALTGTLLVFMGVVGLASGWFGRDTAVAPAAPDTALQDVAGGADVTAPDPVALPDPAAPGDTAEVLPPEADDPPPEAEDVAAADPGPGGAAPDPAADVVAAAGPAAPAAADTLSLSSAGAPQPTPDALRDLGTAAASFAAASPPSPEPDAAGAPQPGPVDPDPALGGEIILPGADALASDRGLAPQVLPLPYAEALRYDAAGLIEPTPEGVVTPDGFTLIAGRPARIPAARPEGLVPAVAVVDGVLIDPAQAAEPLPPNPLAGKRPLPRPAGLAPENDAALTQPANARPAGTATAEPFADPALAGRLPLPRPEGLAVAAPSADPATASATGLATGLAAAPPPLPPPADTRHAALKPKARSATASTAALQREATASAIEAAAAAALAAEAEAASAPGISGATRLAVASSRRPATRPSQFAASVAAALAEVAIEPAAAAQPEAAVQTAAAEPAPAPEPAAQPEAVDEPEPESAAPNIPTRATVAKQATIRNALDLGEVSLIGVYGSSNNRRALVRMSTGRFVKVEVGDRLNGGKVAAIDATQLTYVKNGRSIVLKMIRDS